MSTTTVLSGSARAVTRGALTAVVVLSFLLVVLAPPAAAQVPPLPAPPAPAPLHPPSGSEMKQISLDADTTFVDVPYQAQGIVKIIVRDLSRDSAQGQPGVPFPAPLALEFDQILVSAEFEGGPKIGWGLGLGITSPSLRGGESAEGNLIVQTVGRLEQQIVRIHVNATLHLRNGSKLVEGEVITARVLPYYRGVLQVLEASATAGQFETLTFPVEVTNPSVYPDTYVLNVTAPPGYLAHVTPKVYVPPGEIRYVNLTVVTPKDKLYDFGTPASLVVRMRSENDPTNYESYASIYVRGPYVPKAWLPLVGLVIVSGALLMNRWADEREARALEKGKPRRPRPTPRQEVLLKELKRRDPAAYRERVAQLAAIYAARRQAYREHRRENLALERAERGAARAETRAERRRRREEARAERERLRARAVEERAERKEERKRDRILAEERRRLEKERAKLLAKRGKLQAKEAKRRAKEEAERAKREAKEAKRRAREEKRAGSRKDGP